MLLGNKCDMEDKRVVPKAKGEQVRGHEGNASKYIITSELRAVYHHTTIRTFLKNPL